MKIKTSELIGDQLDYAVEVCELERQERSYMLEDFRLTDDERYSTDWAHAGPIIERENIQLGPPTQSVHRNGGPNAGWGPSGVWSACTWNKGMNGKRSIAHAGSPLVAAMRCYVASKLGDEVEIPEYIK